MPKKYSVNLIKCAFYGFFVWLIFSCGKSSERSDDALRFFLRGKHFLTQKQTSQALRFFSEAIKADSTFSAAYNNRGVAWYQMRDFRKAVKDYDRAIARQSDSVFVDAYYNKANALYALKKYREALGCLDTVLRFYPDSAYVYLNRGTVLGQLNHTQEAIRDFRKVLSLDAKNTAAAVNLGTCLFLSGDTAEAVLLLEKVVAQAPKTHEALNTLGQIAQAQGRYAEALSLFDKALRDVPAQAYYLNNRALAKIKLGQKQAAWDDLKTSLFYAKNNPSTFRNIGLYYLENNEADSAIIWLEKSFSSDPPPEKTAFYLGKAYYAAGQKEKACALWQADSVHSRQVFSAFCLPKL